ncbi:MAG TPA: nitroreductase/quinone reductase family protein [Candidatus Limnocylindrales bacterium]|nr:nitroreductase/quinone reductase family protein [Candidatus Limnocylindrales bacterium]
MDNTDASREAAADAGVTGPGAVRWGDGLGYPSWAAGSMPALHRAFNSVNRSLGAPALRMGLGGMLSTPLTGYLMLLRTRGRTSGLLREAPLGYVISGAHVYCMAGFGRQTHWFRNIATDPRVEVVLPGRAFSGIAEEVTDPDERRDVLPRLLRSMGVIVMATGLPNPWRSSADELLRACEAFPLVRIRATGIAAGPNDPGMLGWIPAQVLWLLPIAWLVGRRVRRRTSSAG